MDIKGEVQSNTVIVGDFNNPFESMNGYIIQTENQQGNGDLK